MKISSTLFYAGMLMSTLCTGFVSCDSKPQPQPIRVSAIELPAILTLEVGEKQTLTANILPADAENKTVSWKSNDESIAKVSSSGEVTPIAAGTTTVIATAADGEKTASCTVTVTAKPVRVSGIELPATLTLEVGEKQTLTATVLPANADNKTISWKSDEESIAEVSSSGEVTAVEAGSTIITVTANDGEKTTSCTVTVTAKADPEPEPGENVPFEVYSFGEGSPARWVNLDYSDSGRGKILVINSDEELQKYVDGDYPPIDFTKKTLLLAFGSTPTEVVKVSIGSLQKLPENKYRLEGEVILNDATRPDLWQAAILIDKLSNDSSIVLSVNIIN